MTTPSPSRRSQRSDKAITDQARVDVLLEEMRQAERILRETKAERVRLALEAYAAGLSMSAIAEALGVSHVAVWKWIRAVEQGATS